MRNASRKGSKTFLNLLQLPMILLGSVICWLLLISTSPTATEVKTDGTLKVVIEERQELTKDGDRLIIDRFSTEMEEGTKGFFVPRGWNLLRFRGTKALTHYAPVEDGNNVFVRAESNASGGPIYKIAKFDPQEYPYISWRWKAEDILEKGNAYSKEGNDFSVSLGIIFDYDPHRASFMKKTIYGLIKMLYGVYPPDYVIAYVWGNGVYEKKGDMISNPYSDIVMMFILESGTPRLNQWIIEERNILEDFKDAFGTYPEQRVGGIGIHTDSDNTSYYYKNEYRVVGYYDDIIVSKTPRSRN